MSSLFVWHHHHSLDKWPHIIGSDPAPESLQHPRSALAMLESYHVFSPWNPAKDPDQVLLVCVSSTGQTRAGARQVCWVSSHQLSPWRRQGRKALRKWLPQIKTQFQTEYIHCSLQIQTGIYFPTGYLAADEFFLQWAQSHRRLSFLTVIFYCLVFWDSIFLC